MKLNELRYVVALAKEGNFSRAAESCGVSQPTLSVAIARIEEELGVQLFERGKNFVSPSDAGYKVVEQARVVLEELDKVKQLAQSGKDQLEGPLRLGVIHTIAPYMLPQMIQGLRLVAPNMPLIIEENMTAHLARLLQDNEIDVAIIALPFEGKDVVTLPVYDEHFELIVPAHHAWAQRKHIKSEDVKGEEVLVLKAGNCFRDQVLDACSNLSGPDTDIRQAHSIGTIRCMVSSGLGISVLPQSANQGPYRNPLVKVIPFESPAPTRRVALAWRTSFVRPKAIDALVAAIRTLDPQVFKRLV